MLTALFFGVLVATVVADSGCPNAKPVENFDMNALVGDWYQAARYKNGLDVVERCYHGISSYDGKKIQIDTSFVPAETPVALDVSILFADAAKDGNVTVKITFKDGKAFTEYNSLVLVVDYSQYALFYSCYVDESSKTAIQLVWIYTRSRTLEGNAKTEVENFFKSSGYLDWDKLIWIDNSEEACTSVNEIGA